MNNLRPTQAGTFSLVRLSLQSNSRRLVSFQQQVASGRRILQPSDDVVGATRALSVRRQLSSAERYLDAINSSKPEVDIATASLQEGGNVLSEARVLLLQAMNGTLAQSDRESIAAQMELLLDSLVDVGNTRSGERYVFSGTKTSTPAFSQSTVGGIPTVQYQGDDSIQRVSIGLDTQISINVPGSEAFGLFEFSGVSFAGLTGVEIGTSANQGVGYEHLEVRHDATSGVLGAGLALANGGADDTIIGPHSLVIDPTAGTVQLGSGPAEFLPDPLVDDFVVKDADGSEVHLDLTGYTGIPVSATLTGSGSISIDGTNFTPINGTEADLQLVDSATGAVLHIDTRSISRAGVELVHFDGAVDSFATLQGIVDDLRNTDGLETSEVV
ncbi:MAG: flagellar hook-associated protein FlgL, partial [Actinomycetota bacterium]